MDLTAFPVLCCICPVSDVCIKYLWLTSTLLGCVCEGCLQGCFSLTNGKSKARKKKTSSCFFLHRTVSYHGSWVACWEFLLRIPLQVLPINLILPVTDHFCSRRGAVVVVHLSLPGSWLSYGVNVLSEPFPTGRREQKFLIPNKQLST